MSSDGFAIASDISSETRILRESQKLFAGGAQRRKGFCGSGCMSRFGVMLAEVMKRKYLLSVWLKAGIVHMLVRSTLVDSKMCVCESPNDVLASLLL